MPEPISIVGAGPGSPDLITVRGQQRIKAADLLIYAGSLVPEPMLEWAPDGCRTLSSASLVLDEIIDEMLNGYRNGENVVRLHSGDPAIYGAIQEQMNRLDEAGVAYEIVPGVSSFLASAAALKSELTVPERVQSIVLSRVEGRAPVPDRESLENFARTGATLCLFLSIKYVRRIQETLTEYYEADTPVAICHRIGWPEEELTVTTLEDLAATADDLGYQRTTLLLVGEAIQAREDTQSGVYDPDHKHVFRPE